MGSDLKLVGAKQRKEEQRAAIAHGLRELQIDLAAHRIDASECALTVCHTAHIVTLYHVRRSETVVNVPNDGCVRL